MRKSEAKVLRLEVELCRSILALSLDNDVFQLKSHLFESTQSRKSKWEKYVVMSDVPNDDCTKPPRLKYRIEPLRRDRESIEKGLWIGNLRKIIRILMRVSQCIAIWRMSTDNVDGPGKDMRQFASISPSNIDLYVWQPVKALAAATGLKLVPR